jgi:maltose O-acetyltransferase
MRLLGNLRTYVKSVMRDVLINTIAASVLIPRTIRKYIYNIYGMRIRSKNIYPCCFFGGNKIAIDEGTFINYQCFFDLSAQVSIGKNCSIAMQVLFCTSTHKIGPSNARANEGYALPISTGDGCWIGARSVIMPGVTVGNGCIIGSGAVVTEDCSPNGLYAGVPSRRIKDLS